MTLPNLSVNQTTAAAVGDMGDVGLGAKTYAGNNINFADKNIVFKIGLVAFVGYYFLKRFKVI